MKILVVEDNPVHSQLTRKILSNISGAEILSARDAFDAFAILRAAADVDVVVLDNHMPYVNGLPFISKLRDTPVFANIGIVAASGDEEANFLQHGADAQVRKPYNADALINAVTTIKA